MLAVFTVFVVTGVGVTAVAVTWKRGHREQRSYRHCVSKTFVFDRGNSDKPTALFASPVGTLRATVFETRSCGSTHVVFAGSTRDSDRASLAVGAQSSARRRLHLFAAVSFRGFDGSLG
jgi:hypothetical protein